LNTHSEDKQLRAFSVAVFAVGLITFASHAGTAQNKPEASRETELKEVSTTLPNGEPITMRALNIDRTWEPATTHLTGNVQILIRETIKAGNRFVVIRADEASFNEKSGELTPIGNVRVTQELR
jgi:lipopolysaccharide assembly outer membrane protein LptD (OstA)